ncbi:patatin-like phospholipase family protein [Jiulongibacter sp. NS-SX5]|uniref:patatin-like phospholipase family protein n=1 Tax=Jiulongibacter sp. NS-SX5 TaxID=3463854 RepID=UPI004059576D
MSKKKIGLCLSGGGARGFAHLGVLHAFDELKVPISKISGSSAGAFAALFYAAGYTPKESLEIIIKKRFWQYVAFRPTKLGFLSMDKTAGIFRKLCQEDSFESLKMPISVCATNISKGKAEYFEKGELIKPVIASASVPIAFKPININGDLYLDGGLSDNLPLEPLDDCDYKIAVNVTPFHPRLPVKSMKTAILKSVYISIDNQTRARAKKADLVIEPEGIMHFDGFKLRHAEKLFETGYKSTIKLLKENGIDTWQ